MHKTGKTRGERHAAFKVALVFFIASSLWILLSDRAIELLSPGPEFVSTLQTYKGLVYTFVMAALIYAAVERYMRRIRKASEALGESEFRYRKLVEDLPVPVLVFQGGEAVYLNPEALKLLGAPGASDASILLPGLIHPDDLERFEYLAGVCDGDFHPRKREEIRLVPPDAETVQLDVTSIPVDFWGDSSFLLIASDITQRKVFETALAESETRYRELFEKMHVAFAVHEVVRDDTGAPCDYTFLEVNPAFEELTGLKAADVSGNNVRSVLPEIESYWIDTYGKVALSGEPARIEHFAAPLGRYFDVMVYSPNEGQFATLFYDVTARFEAQEALRERERQIRAQLTELDELYKNTPVGLCLVDRDFRYVRINDRLAEMNGRSVQEHIGHTIFEMVPDVAPRLEMYYRQVFDEAKELVNVEITRMQAENSPSCRLSSFFPFRPDGSTIEGLIAAVVDVSEMKQKEIALAESQARLRQIVDLVPHLIFVRDQDGRYLLANQAVAAALGKDISEVTGKLHQELYPEDPDLTRIIEKDLEVIETGEPVTYVDERFLPSLGEKRWVHVAKVPYIPHGASSRCVLGLVMDITPLRRAEEQRKNLEGQVRHAQKLESLGVLAGGIAHDFNNILMTIIGNADLALEDLSPVAPARESIIEIERAAKNAADLCRQMLVYSGRGKFVIEAVNLGELVTEMSHMLEVSITKKAVLKFKLAENLPPIDADATQIRQVIMNLITNASEAIGERSGVISISTGAMSCDYAYLQRTYLDEDLAEGLYVYIEVADTGCGMDRETQSKIFEPFFTTKFTGRGLGLAAVLGIVRGHGGALKVYSEPGRGSTFKALFPASEIALETANHQIDRAQARWEGTGTVLLVDDEETVRALGKRMLERAGFQVLCASDGREAVQVYKEHQDSLACVVLDMTMPHMDGEEAFRELRRINQHVRVILSSGYNEQEITERFAGKGLAGFIQKPYRSEELRALLREVLGESGS